MAATSVVQEVGNLKGYGQCRGFKVVKYCS